MNVPSFRRFLPMVRSGDTIIVNSDMVDPTLNTRKDVRIVAVPCSTMAKAMIHPLGANIIMAGVIVKETGDFTEAEALEGMNDMFRKKGKERFQTLNSAALKAKYHFS